MKALLLTFILTGCAATLPTTEAPDCCRHFKPISLSDEDTVETQDQIIDYLIMYETLCIGEK